MADHSERIALVTGANRGIGFEVCRQLAAKGFVVLLTARDTGKANAAARKLAHAGAVESLLLDVADPRSIRNAADEVANRYGCLDVLINNAGIHYDTWETAGNADIDGTVMETIATKRCDRPYLLPLPLVAAIAASIAGNGRPLCSWLLQVAATCWGHGACARHSCLCCERADPRASSMCRPNQDRSHAWAPVRRPIK